MKMLCRISNRICVLINRVILIFCALEIFGTGELVIDVLNEKAYVANAFIEDVILPDGYYIGKIIDNNGNERRNVPISNGTWTRKEALRRYNHDIGKNIRVFFFPQKGNAILYIEEIRKSVFSFAYVTLYIIIRMKMKIL